MPTVGKNLLFYAYPISFLASSNAKVANYDMRPIVFCVWSGQGQIEL